MKNKILVTGGNGMLGKSLKKYFPKATYLNGKKDFRSKKVGGGG